MRKDHNKQKDKIANATTALHRVIIPIYIPNEEEYYKDAFDVFLLCIKSLRMTSASNLQISVCSNGCSDAVNKKLFKLYEDNLIDDLVIERKNTGKINSILRVIRTAEERFITITDADVMFLNNWENSVFEVFESFHKAAVVSPMPVFRTQNHYTSNLIFDYFFSKRLKFSTVKNPEALTRFAKSIGWSRLDSEWKDVIMTIEDQKGLKAVLGSNHCVATYKREIFRSIPKKNSKYVLGGDSEGLYLDKPSRFYDGYRLSTYDNFAYHLGNEKEDWMEEEFQLLKYNNKSDFFPKSRLLKKSNLAFILKNILFRKVINNSYFRGKFYVWKRLDKTKLKNFI